eukprot:10338229-Prorocentrum_lima.AAC.1
MLAPIPTELDLRLAKMETSLHYLTQATPTLANQLVAASAQGEQLRKLVGHFQTLHGKLLTQFEMV